METQTVTLRAGSDETPRRHAAIFLVRGCYLLRLIEPAGKPSATDMRAWTAWKDPARPWLSAFKVVSPGVHGGAVQSFAAAPQDDRDAVREAFNCLPDAQRSLEIVAQADSFGHPVFFYIDDEKDDDNRGGLTIEITRLTPER